MEFEGSEVGIVNILRKMKVLGGVAGRRRELLQGEETARPRSKKIGKRKVWAPRALPQTLATHAPSRPVLSDPPGLVPGP